MLRGPGGCWIVTCTSLVDKYVDIGHVDDHNRHNAEEIVIMMIAIEADDHGSNIGVMHDNIGHL